MYFLNKFLLNVCHVIHNEVCGLKYRCDQFESNRHIHFVEAYNVCIN